MPMHETLRVYADDLAREPNMNTTTTTDITNDYEDRQYRIFMRWLATLAVLVITATAVWKLTGCTPDQYASDVDNVVHNEQGLRNVK